MWFQVAADWVVFTINSKTGFDNVHKAYVRILTEWFQYIHDESVPHLKVFPGGDGGSLKNWKGSKYCESSILYTKGFILCYPSKQVLDEHLLFRRRLRREMFNLIPKQKTPSWICSKAAFCYICNRHIRIIFCSLVK